MVDLLWRFDRNISIPRIMDGRPQVEHQLIPQTQDVDDNGYTTPHQGDAQLDAAQPNSQHPPTSTGNGTTSAAAQKLSPDENQLSQEEIQEITRKAIEILSLNLDCQEQAKFVKEMEEDDVDEGIAYDEELVVMFVVKGIREELQDPAPPPLEVMAPIYQSVSYLKRRVTKAFLFQRGQYCPPNRFDLRSTVDVQSLEQGFKQQVLPETSETGLSVRLRDLGFEKGLAYELRLTSAPVVDHRSDHEQMLQNVAASSRGPPLVRSSKPEVRNYQDLLHAPEIAAPQRGPSGGATVSIEAPSGPVQRKNARGGAWSPEEVEALVNGVQIYGQSSWAKILNRFRGNPLDFKRTGTDLKDKWRNLVSAASNPSKARAQGLSDEMILQILRLSNENMGKRFHDILNDDFRPEEGEAHLEKRTRS